MSPSGHTAAYKRPRLARACKRHIPSKRHYFSDFCPARLFRGLRSTFRDWVAENEQSREAAELQLAHQFGSAVEHAYYRSDLLDQRARLLDDWYNFLEHQQ
jgi:hypothetical protein